MKKEKISVKSKGVEVGVVDVEQFDTLAEASQFFKGDATCLLLVNRQHKTDKTNEFRASLTRTASPTARLAKLAKTNPAAEKEIAALIAKYSQGTGTPAPAPAV